MSIKNYCEIDAFPLAVFSIRNFNLHNLKGNVNAPKEIMNSASSKICRVFFTLISSSRTSPVEQVWAVLGVYSFILFPRAQRHLRRPVKFPWKVSLVNIQKQSTFYLVVFAKASILLLSSPKIWPKIQPWILNLSNICVMDMNNASNHSLSWRGVLILF